MAFFFDLRASAANHFDTRSTSPDLTSCRQDTSFGVVLVASARATLTAGTGGDLLRASRCRDADGHDGECDELFHGVLSLRSIGFSGDTAPIAGDDLPRGKGAKMYVVHKIHESPRPWKRNGHEEACQIPHAGLPTAAKVDAFISI